jgi:hypothetical protein
MGCIIAMTFGGGGVGELGNDEAIVGRQYAVSWMKRGIV